jgi:hypothetical protein
VQYDYARTLNSYGNLGSELIRIIFMHTIALFLSCIAMQEEGQEKSRREIVLLRGVSVSTIEVGGRVHSVPYSGLCSLSAVTSPRRLIDTARASTDLDAAPPSTGWPAN